MSAYYRIVNISEHRAKGFCCCNLRAYSVVANIARMPNFIRFSNMFLELWVEIVVRIRYQKDLLQNLLNSKKGNDVLKLSVVAEV